ncbi:MAG: tetratricopeptide repeat-containing protein [Granulosicoccus sp.]
MESGEPETDNTHKHSGRAFVIRPFGQKESSSGDVIDFDHVHEHLIAVALKKTGFTGGTTAKFIAQGSIHEDMFREIIIADLVIADVSIHNANAFYELGIRHALRKGHTIIIRADKYNDKRVFDLNSERNMSYSLDDPGSSVGMLVDTINSTISSTQNDSPVFRLLPRLKPVNTSDAQMVPQALCEKIHEIIDGQGSDKAAQLVALKQETIGQFWEREGFLHIARAQSTLPDHQGAITTWEYLRHSAAYKAEANQRLATSYQKTGQLAKSENAANRSLDYTSLSDWQRAETYSLIGSNIKRRWLSQFSSMENLTSRQRIALSSDLLRESYSAYAKGFDSHPSHFYSGLNAVLLRAIQLELADIHPDEWRHVCEMDEREPDYTLFIRRKHLDKLIAATDLAIRSSIHKADKNAEPWNAISAAELLMVSCEEPERVVAAYQRVSHHLNGIALGVIAEQLALYKTLQVFSENANAVSESLTSVIAEHNHGK